MEIYIHKSKMTTIISIMKRKNQHAVLSTRRSHKLQLLRDIHRRIWKNKQDYEREN